MAKTAPAFQSDGVFSGGRSSAGAEISFVQNVNRGNVGGKGYLHYL